MTLPAYILVAPDGIYDNRSLMRREVWTGGRVSWVTARHLAAGKQVATLTAEQWRKPWGHYPGTPTLTPTPVQDCSTCYYDPNHYGICNRCVDFDQWQPHKEGADQ